MNTKAQQLCLKSTGVHFNLDNALVVRIITKQFQQLKLSSTWQWALTLAS